MEALRQQRQHMQDEVDSVSADAACLMSELKETSALQQSSTALLPMCQNHTHFLPCFPVENLRNANGLIFPLVPLLLLLHCCGMHAGPSKLIQALLTRLLNPGELEWLQLLNSRETLAKQHTALQDIESSHAPLDPTNSSSSASGAGFNTLFTLLQGSELARLQGLAKGGGRLEQLQLTPMQLAEMVQDCAVTLDGPETAAVASLLAALDSSTAGSAAAVAAGAEALSICGLWPEMGLMKQSCAANVTVTCVLGPAAAGGAAGAPVAAGEEFQEALLVVRAARDLPAGTEVGEGGRRGMQERPGGTIFCCWLKRWWSPVDRPHV